MFILYMSDTPLQFLLQAESPVLLVEVVGGWNKAPVFIPLPWEIEEAGLNNNWNRDKLANFTLKLRAQILEENQNTRREQVVDKCLHYFRIFKSHLDKILA